MISTVERGHLEDLKVGAIRRIFGRVDARLLVEPRWRGAELERLLDVDHAAIVEAVAQRLEAAGWTVLVETTYAYGPERGSIDVIGVRADRRAVVACEIKTDVPAADAVARKLDEKRRLVPLIVRDRFGWTPAVVGAVLAMPESPRLRRVLTGPAASLARAFPIASRRVSAWLRDPDGPLAATWFLSNMALSNPRLVRTGSAGSK